MRQLYNGSMKRNLLLIFAVIVGLLLAYNSARKIASYRGTSQKITDEQVKLEQLRQENAELKQELEYKKSDKFAEGEIRNKLGLAKPGEEVFVVPKDVNRQSLIVNRDDGKPNWQKWKDYLFEGKS